MIRRLRRWWASERWVMMHRQPRNARPVIGLVWVGFILVPIVDAVGRSGQSSFGHWLVIAAALAFSGAYIWLVVIWLKGHWPLELSLAGVMLALAIALTAADQSNWGYLFTYCAACGALVLPSAIGFWAVVWCAAIAVGATVVGGGSFGTGLGFAASTVGVGFLLTLMRDLRFRNHELSEARAELAHTAVAAERERFARDLHDLLGHSLSVIAIKAELAGRLLPDEPGRAASEVSDLETVARQALGEVRQAVSGYGQPTLAGELEGARIALTAAGIDASFEQPSLSLDPEVEAVLAWAVREGATNVIRHSGAHRCQVMVRAGSTDAAVEVVDDGAGAIVGDAGPQAAGNGLAGLRERARALRGAVDAAALPEGGYRLAVSVPVSAGSESGDGR